MKRRVWLNGSKLPNAGLGGLFNRTWLVLVLCRTATVQLVGINLEWRHWVICLVLLLWDLPPPRPSFACWIFSLTKVLLHFQFNFKTLIFFPAQMTYIPQSEWRRINFPQLCFQTMPYLLFRTRRERLKSALYLRLKKRKVLKIVKGDSFNFLKIQFVAKYQENWKGTLWRHSKKFEIFFEVFEKTKNENFETVS